MTESEGPPSRQALYSCGSEQVTVGQRPGSAASSEHRYVGQRENRFNQKLSELDKDYAVPSELLRALPLA